MTGHDNEVLVQQIAVSSAHRWAAKVGAPRKQDGRLGAQNETGLTQYRKVRKPSRAKERRPDQ